MWDTLQGTHEGTTYVKKVRVNTLTHGYELFRMKPEENIQNMKKHFINIVIFLRNLVKTF